MKSAHVHPRTPRLPSTRPPLRRARLAAALALAATLAACGGGSDTPAATDPVALPAAVILAQPLDSQVIAGATARFSVSSSGQALTYRWQRSTDGGQSWQDVAGASASTLEIAAVDLSANGLLVRAVIEQAGVSTPSSAARLTVTAAVVAPAISVAPIPATVVAGTDASLTITASGTSLSYQWQRSNNGTQWTDIAGQTSPTLTLPAVGLDSDGLQLRVVVSNAAGSVTSAAVQLTVQAAAAQPGISSQPRATSVVAPAAATFTVVATGQPAPSYQWQRSTDGGATYADVAGATAANYTTGPTSLSNNGERWRVKVTNSAGSVLSDALTLTVTAAQVAPTLSQQPLDQSVSAGQLVTLSTSADGTPSPALQWQFSTDDGKTWTNINGATAGSYAFTAALSDNGRRYRVVATNSVGSANSRGALLTVAAVSTLTNRSWLAGQRWVGPDATASALDQGLASGSLVYVTKSVIDAQGRVTVVYSRYEGSAVRLAAVRVLPGVAGSPAQVGTPVLIDTGAPAEVLADVVLAAAPNGNLVAGWSRKAPCTAQTYATTGSCNYLYTARYLAASGQWQAPVLLADTPATEFGLAINDAGDVLARYYSLSGNVYSAIAWRGNGQDAWGRVLFNLDSGFVPAAIALDGAGRFTAAGNKVQAGGSRNYDLATLRGSMAGGAGAVEVVDQRGATTVLDGLFGNSAGQQVLMWRQDNGVRISMYAATLDATTNAWQVTDLGVQPPTASPVPGALAEDGSFQWYSFSSGRCSTQRRLAGVWGQETALPTAVCQGVPKVAVAPNGNLLAVRTTAGLAGQWVSFDASSQKLMHAPAATPVAADYLVGLQGILDGELLLSSSGVGTFVSVNKYDVLPTIAAPNGDSRGLNSLWGFTFK